MQPVQGYLCMMVLFQGVGCNLCFVCVSFFIVFKSIKRSMHNVGCIGCVTISTRTGVYEFRSVTCIKGYVFSLQTTHILFCQRAWYKRRGFAVINIDIISYWVVKNMILRFRPCWAYPVGWSNCWVYPVGRSIYGGRVEVEEGQEGSIETIEVVGPR